MEEFNQRNIEQEHIDFADAYGMFMVGLSALAVVLGVAEWLLK